MGAVLGTSIGTSESPSLPSTMQPTYKGGCTRRVEELEAIVEGLREALRNAEEELQREKARPPEVGDFVRCPLTNFFGQVTKVTPRAQGRPWVEITPYLTKDLPGHGTMDLYDSWELIDPPEYDEKPRPFVTKSNANGLPSVSSFAWAPKPSSEDQLSGEIESLLGELWANPDRSAR